MAHHGADGPVHGEPAPAAIDRSVLGEWLEGDDSAINELLAIFKESIHLEHANLIMALEQRDLIEYGKTAHRLRGAALAMGARVLGDAASTLEAAALTGDHAACVAGMTGLEREIHRMAADVPIGGPGA